MDSQKHGGNITDLTGDEIACIDHHPARGGCGYKYADIRMTGACSTIIADYFRSLSKKPDVDTAPASLTGCVPGEPEILGGPGAPVYMVTLQICADARA